MSIPLVKLAQPPTDSRFLRPNLMEVTAEPLDPKIINWLSIDIDFQPNIVPSEEPGNSFTYKNPTTGLQTYGFIHGEVFAIESRELAHGEHIATATKILTIKVLRNPTARTRLHFARDVETLVDVMIGEYSERAVIAQEWAAPGPDGLFEDGSINVQCTALTEMKVKPSVGSQVCVYGTFHRRDRFQSDISTRTYGIIARGLEVIPPPYLRILGVTTKLPVDAMSRDPVLHIFASVGNITLTEQILQFPMILPHGPARIRAAVRLTPRKAMHRGVYIPGPSAGSETSRPSPRRINLGPNETAFTKMRRLSELQFGRDLSIHFLYSDPVSRSFQYKADHQIIVTGRIARLHAREGGPNVIHTIFIKDPARNIFDNLLFRSQCHVLNSIMTFEQTEANTNRDPFIVVDKWTSNAPYAPSGIRSTDKVDQDKYIAIQHTCLCNTSIDALKAGDVVSVRCTLYRRDGYEFRCPTKVYGLLAGSIDTVPTPGSAV
ncbi:hypothetical protein DFH09DRAFT_1376078 [Mycena vulgaris]|nr:hypothetical protein DFH09DRAFT_1376078 [Mycena vulgaris]